MSSAQKIASRMHSDYLSTLQKLFKSVKGPSRHTNTPAVAPTTAPAPAPSVTSSVESKAPGGGGGMEIFNERKAFFASLFAKAFPGSLSESSPMSSSTTRSSDFKIPKIIHVAGTKGKGSTVELIAAALRAPSLKNNVGIFTSPHLHTARERIKIGDKLIPIEDFTKLGEKALIDLQEYNWVVFFDYLLAMSIDYFGACQCDHIVIETGIGGRFDSTNFHASPAAVVITSISYDHQNVLGDTLEQIAWQKAGIIKPNSHVFTPANQPSGVIDVFRRQCQELNATLHVVNVSEEDIFAGAHGLHETHLENICLAKAVLKFLQVPPDGIKDFYWPCRFETFSLLSNSSDSKSSDINSSSNSNNSNGSNSNDDDSSGGDGGGINTTTSTTATTFDRSLVIDGCHNGDSALRFMQALRHKYPQHKIYTLFGAGQDKSLQDIIEPIYKISDGILITQSTHFKSMSEKALVDMTTKLVGCEKILQLRRDFLDSCSSNGGNSLDLLSPQEHTNGGTIADRMHQLFDWSGKTASVINNNNPSSLSSALSASTTSTRGNGVVIAVCGSLFVASDSREELYKMNPNYFSKFDWVTQSDNYLS